jgi:hypothetical protein
VKVGDPAHSWGDIESTVSIARPFESDRPPGAGWNRRVTLDPGNYALVRPVALCVTGKQHFMQEMITRFSVA